MKKIMFLFFILTILTYSEEKLKIKILTSEFPPYNYTTNDGKLTGLNTEIVQEVLKELGIKSTITSEPWARIYKETQDNANTLLFSITKTKEREKLFKWIGVLSPADYSLWSLKKRGDVNPKNIKELEKYKIGTTNQDVVEQYLKSLGITVESVAGQNAYEQNIQKLLTGRIDIWGVATLPGAYFLNHTQNGKEVTRLFVLDGIPNDGMYLAFGPKTDDVLVERFRKALESVKKKPVYKKLLEKYGVLEFYKNLNL